MEKDIRSTTAIFARLPRLCRQREVPHESSSWIVIFSKCGYQVWEVQRHESQCPRASTMTDGTALVGLFVRAFPIPPPPPPRPPLPPRFGRGVFVLLRLSD